MNIVQTPDGFEVVLAGRTLIRHSRRTPFAYLGYGEPSIEMNRGNFKIEDYLVERIPLSRSRLVKEDAQGVRIELAVEDGPSRLAVTLEGGEAEARLVLTDLQPGANRLWLRFLAEPGEQVWGCGEQMSYFDLKGRRFPLWTSEPGQGRDKSTRLTFLADRAGAGGDYYNTNYPQPTFLSSRRYALHLDTTAYSAFDFRHDAFHELEVWDIPRAIELWTADRFVDLVSALSLRFGRQPALPDWVMDGAIIGLKDGERSFQRLETFRAAGAAVSGLWCEDWVGLRETSFGRRLFWDWRWDAERYPDLERRIRDLNSEGIRFLGYVNPYLCIDGSLFPAAAAAGWLALRPDSDEPYLVDFGEFECGVVDFTNPEAARWFAEDVIGRNMIDLGLSGWMADFGEYLPHDVRLANGVSALLAHNDWPRLWAQVNAKALASRGQTGQAIFFMRAGYTGVQRHCPLLWGGDQSVDFSRHDGLQTVICAALSSGLMGNAYHHSDIGGYTSLFGNVRTKELLQRWSEMAAFTPVMRSHEGNRPLENLQLDQDPEVLAHFCRMTRIHRHLAPYLRSLCAEAVARGLPAQRPLFLHFEDDPRAFHTQTEYLYGPDLLVAPVIEAGAAARRVYLPKGAVWIHVWSGEGFEGQETEVPAPIGQPAVFFRQGSSHQRLLEAIAGY